VRSEARDARRRILRLVLVACAALAAPSLSPERLTAQLPETEVARVRFVGNETFPEDSLERAIVTRATRCRSVYFQPFCWLGLDFAHERYTLRPRELPRDLARLRIWYARRGFREVALDTAATTIQADDRAVVTFTIDEGLPVLAERIEFVGAGDDPEAGLGPDLLEDLPLREGGRLSTIALDATRDTLIARLRDRGYAHADVLRQSLIPAESPRSAQVTFEIEPGTRARYGEISVVGTRSLDEGTVVRTLQFGPGDLFRASQLLEAQGRLFGMEIVRSASVAADLTAGSDSVVPVRVEVREGDAYRLRGGAGWTSAECLNVESTWTARNFLGGGRTLRLRGRVSNLLTRDFGDLLCNLRGRTGPHEDLTWVVSADFQQPWIFSTRNSLGASVFAERQSVPDIFIRHAIGLQVALTRAIGPRTPLTLSYRPERSRLDAAEVLFCTGFLVCTPEDVRILAGTNVLAPVGLNFTRDRSNDVFSPDRGYRLAMDVEHAASWTGSDFRYDRVSVEGTSYHRLSPSTVLATRLRAGWVGAGGFDELLGPSRTVDIVHPQKRFYAGGANSVRGFGQSRLGPRVLTLREPLQGSILLDPERGAGCTPAQVMDLSCDPAAISEENLLPRPTGGNRVLEGNLEVRFGLGHGLELVTFADAGQVWAAGDGVSLGDVEVTPGVGLRFITPVGPVRVDVGYRFRGAEPLPVVASQIAPAGPGVCDSLVPDATCFTHEGTWYVRSGDLAILSTPFLYGVEGSRFQIHFSIGQAF